MEKQRRFDAGETVEKLSDERLEDTNSDGTMSIDDVNTDLQDHGDDGL